MSVTAAKGFTAAGVVAGIKASGKPDLALVVNEGPQAHAAAVFTSNRFQAAPVLWTKQAMARRGLLGNRSDQRTRQFRRRQSSRRGGPGLVDRSQHTTDTCALQCRDIVNFGKAEKI